MTINPNGAQNNSAERASTIISAGCAVVSVVATIAGIWISTRSAAASAPSSTTVSLKGINTDVDCPTARQHGEMVYGKAHMKRDEGLWIAVDSPGTGELYFVSSAPLQLDDDRWTQEIPTIGDTQDSGVRFHVLAVAANTNATALFERLVKDNAGNAYIPAFPVGSYVMTVQCVKRA